MSSFSLSNPQITAFRRQLLGWYAKHQRDLPWRKNTDPYRILVSELMCQQTQIKTVLPYYAKFMQLFPTAKALAEAPQESVLAAWAGLGYYRRARFLQAAAQAVAESGFPETGEGLLELPGVGAYTAAAIGSISFGLAMAVVDGNVIRVLSRVLAFKPDPTSGQGKRLMAEAAQALLDPQQPGNANQALMELGALICSPTKPDCGACPLAKLCRAHALQKEESFPRLPKAVETLKVHKAVALVVKGDEVLAAPRTLSGRTGDQGRMLGFWHFPEMELKAGEAAQTAAQRLAGKNARLVGKLTSLRHSVTRYRITLEAYQFEAKAAFGDWRWIRLGDLAAKPLASAEKKLLKALKAARAEV